MLVEQHLNSLAPVFDLTPENDPRFAEETMVAVSKMMVTLGGREAGELAGEARGEAFMAALEDVPSWAVREASRKWYRGECGPGHDYKWMPAPSTLREISVNEVWRVKGAQRQLRDLKDAEPLAEFTKDHRDLMKANIPTPKLQRA